MAKMIEDDRSDTSRMENPVLPEKVHLCTSVVKSGLFLCRKYLFRYQINTDGREENF